MGAAVSRVVRTARPSPPRVTEEAVKKAVSPHELERQAHIQEALQHAKYEEGKDQQLVTDMSELMTSIGSRQVQLYSNPKMDKLYSRRRKTREEKEAEEVGRLTTATLKSLFADHLRAWQHGQELSVEQLAREYGANAEVLKRVLLYNRVPAVQQAPDGRLIGTWPE